MSKRPVRLSGGDGWTGHLAGGAKPNPRDARSQVLSLPPEEVVYYLDRRVQQMETALQCSDFRGAKAPLEETVVMLAMTSHLPGDAERRATLRALVERLLDADPETR